MVFVNTPVGYVKTDKNVFVFQKTRFKEKLKTT